MDGPITLRRAGVGDAPALARLINAAYRGDSSRVGWTTEADLVGGQRVSTAALASELADPGLTMTIAEGVGGAVVGCFRWERDPHGSADGYIGMITVAPEAQGSGLGRRFIAEGERMAREHGCPGQLMWVLAQRQELKAYYARRGYADTGERVPFPYDDPTVGEPLRDDLEFAVLRKDLPALP